MTEELLYEGKAKKVFATDDEGVSWPRAYRHKGFFYAMDTYREYVYLNDLWNSGQAPWAKWKTR